MSNTFVMSKISEVIYMILDELKMTSDDSFFNERHIAFLIANYRALFIKREYLAKKILDDLIPDTNYQTLCLDLEYTGDDCDIDDVPFLKSKKKIPKLMGVGKVTLNTCSMVNDSLDFVTMSSLKYSGNGRFDGNRLFAAIGPDQHLYIRSKNPQFKYLKQVKITALFDDIKDEDGSELGSGCNGYDIELPVESAMLPKIITSIVQELSGSVYKPQDKVNNNNDDLSKVGLATASTKRSKDE